MAIQTFSVTYTTVRDHHFAQLPDFSNTSNPAAATVTTMIQAAASSLGGALRAQDVTPATVNNSSTYPESHAWCADVIRHDAAVRVARVMTGHNPDVVKAWEAHVKAQYKALAEHGYLALGDAPAPAENATGPRTHIDRNSLTTTASADMSDAEPAFRKSDVM